MGQQILTYSFVARGTVVLAEYTEFTGNFTSITSQCRQKLPTTTNKFTYNCGGHIFNYLVEDGYSTRFQAAGHNDEEKDVVSEHEDKTDCVWHHR